MSDVEALATLARGRLFVFRLLTEAIDFGERDSFDRRGKFDSSDATVPNHAPNRLPRNVHELGESAFRQIARGLLAAFA